MKKALLAFIVGCFLLISAESHASGLTYLAFDSSPESWVGQGESFYVTPDDGYAFEWRFAYPNSNSFRFSIDNGDYYWTLHLAAPYDDLIQKGYYADSARFAFQDDDQPGLTFSGNGYGCNDLTGFFEVLEVSYDSEGTLESFSVNFTQYESGIEDKWLQGELRYNATVPEPAAVALFGVGLLGVFLGRGLRRR